MRFNSRYFLHLFLLTFIYAILQFSSCAPVFSDLQSARTVGKGNVESTPSYSSVSFADDGDSDKLQNNYGLQVGYGLSDKTDLRFRAEHILLDNDGGNATVLGVGPKFSLKKDRIAGYVPIGFAVGENIETSDTWEIQPTLLFTFPISDKLEFNPSAKYLITLAEDNDDLVAVNFGFGFSSDLQKWVVRPEYGLLYNPGESGHFSHFSLGVTIYH